MKVLVIKPLVDTKGGDTIVSRIGLSRSVDHLVEPGEDLYKYLKKIKGVSCIFVDEAQFLERGQIDDLLRIVVDYDVPIICYGLRTDFNTNGFEGRCECGKKATFNARMVNGDFVFDGDQVAIDGEDEVTYESLCPKCYYKKKNSYKKKTRK